MRANFLAFTRTTAESRNMSTLLPILLAIYAGFVHSDTWEVMAIFPDKESKTFAMNTPDLIKLDAVNKQMSGGVVCAVSERSVDGEGENLSFRRDIECMGKNLHVSAPAACTKGGSSQSTLHVTVGAKFDRKFVLQLRCKP